LVVNVDVSIYISQLLAGGQAGLADAVFQPVNQVIKVGTTTPGRGQSTKEEEDTGFK
jgi:hypothetical protein